MDDQFWTGVLAGVGAAATLAMLLAPWLRRRTSNSRMIVPWAYWAIFGLVAGLGFGYWLPGILAAVAGGFVVGLLVGAVARDYGHAEDLESVMLGAGAVVGVVIGYLGSLWLPEMLSAAILIALTVVAVGYRRRVKAEEVKTPDPLAD